MTEQAALSKEAIEALRWLRDNPHHYSSWEPQDNFPNFEYMLVCGDDCRIEIPVQVTKETLGLLRYDHPDHMFYPKPEVLKVIK